VTAPAAEGVEVEEVEVLGVEVWEEEEVVVEVEFGFTLVTWPSTSQAPRPCSQQEVALAELGPPAQHQDWSGHWWTGWSMPGRSARLVWGVEEWGSSLEAVEGMWRTGVFIVGSGSV